LADGHVHPLTLGQHPFPPSWTPANEVINLMYHLSCSRLFLLKVLSILGLECQLQKTHANNPIITN
jgi:hypothetical protein